MNNQLKKAIHDKFNTKRYNRIILTFSLSLCIFWSTAPGLKTAIASAAYLLNNDETPESFLTPLSTQRKIQKHFLSYGVYIPIDDIVVNMGLNKLDNYNQLHESTCGTAKIYIWLPIKIRFPII